MWTQEQFRQYCRNKINQYPKVLQNPSMMVLSAYYKGCNGVEGCEGKDYHYKARAIAIDEIGIYMQKLKQ